MENKTLASSFEDLIDELLDSPYPDESENDVMYASPGQMADMARPIRRQLSLPHSSDRCLGTRPAEPIGLGEAAR